MPRKVIARKETSRQAGTVTRRLAKWMVENGYRRDAEDAIKDAGRAGEELAAGAEAEEMWIEVLTEGQEEIGPIRISRKVSRAVQEGWEIGGRVGQGKRRWVLPGIWSGSVGGGRALGVMQGEVRRPGRAALVLAHQRRAGREDRPAGQRTRPTKEPG